MEITRIWAVPFELPLHHVIRWANGSISSAQHVLIAIETADGVRGYAEAIPRPMHYGETTESIIAAIDTFVRPAIVGRSVLDRAGVAHALRDVEHNNSALAAVDTAMWDALGKSLGVSVHRLLGGFADRVRVSAVLGDGDPDALVAEALTFSESSGITSFKVKVGWDVRRDSHLIRSLRDALPDAHLCADANHGFSATEALDFLERVHPAGLAWIEEPSPVADPLGRERVMARSSIDILGDESCRTAGEVMQEVLARRSSMVSIKIARTGITHSERIRGFCESRGTAMVIGNQGDSAMGTWASVAFAGANASTVQHPCEMAYYLHLAGDIATAPTISDGHIAIPDAPGFGFDIDFGQLAGYTRHQDAVAELAA